MKTGDQITPAQATKTAIKDYLKYARKVIETPKREVQDKGYLAIRKYPKELLLHENNINSYMKPICKLAQEGSKTKYQILQFLIPVIKHFDMYQKSFNAYEIRTGNDLNDILKLPEINNDQKTEIERYRLSVNTYSQLIKKAK